MQHCLGKYITTIEIGFQNHTGIWKLELKLCDIFSSKSKPKVTKRRICFLKNYICTISWSFLNSNLYYFNFRQIWSIPSLVAAFKDFILLKIILKGTKNQYWILLPHFFSNTNIGKLVLSTFLVQLIQLHYISKYFERTYFNVITIERFLFALNYRNSIQTSQYCWGISFQVKIEKWCYFQSTLCRV